MTKILTLEDIKLLFKHSDLDWELINHAVLYESQKEESFQFIIDQLDSNDIAVRYLASHLIIEFKIQAAKNKLIERILDSDTLNANGTMTYALQHLNCKDKLVEVFEILATQSYESKCHAFNILSEQIFEFTKDDFTKLTQIWNRAKDNPTKHQVFDDDTLEMIKDAYDGFLSYFD